MRRIDSDVQIQDRTVVLRWNVIPEREQDSIPRAHLAEFISRRIALQCLRNRISGSVPDCRPEWLYDWHVSVIQEHYDRPRHASNTEADDQDHRRVNHFDFSTAGLA